MNVRMVLACALGVMVAVPQNAPAGAWVHHDMTIDLRPDQHVLHVDDTITLPSVWRTGTPIHFLLHAGLNPTSTMPGVTVARSPVSSLSAPLARLAVDARVPMESYTVSIPPDRRAFTLRYEGEIIHSSENEEDTPGSIAAEGIFLAASSLWYPLFDDALVTFSLEVHAPPGWRVISQGTPPRAPGSGPQGMTRWESSEPQEDIYLVGGPLTEYAKRAGTVTAMVFLRAPDHALADRYLGATARYLGMYSALLGPYPYAKFALVENFWETGYGMPSFTLLGSTVLRLPFILDSSYPHEIVHNWWGNGVFVDPVQGNWSEGLTAYLADHLLAEQQGTGVAYRQATLQKYADYVAEGKDFPITQFRARSSAATEAVGYGKTLMVFHMLRRQFGDDTFVRALRRFYRENRFRRATFSDLERAFSNESGVNVKALMAPWIERAGAPALMVSNAKAEARGNGYLLTSQVEQTQSGAAYRLRVPVAITIEGREQAYQTSFKLEAKQLGLELIVPGRPLRFDIDPEFDVFRRLDRAEIPPALSGMFGAQRITIVLPSAAGDTLREGYRRLANSWKTSQAGKVDVVSDSELTTLPLDRAVWVVGWENRFRPDVASALAEQSVDITDSAVRIGSVELRRADHAVVLASRRQATPASALGWLATDRVGALPGLARKLPHYGKYGYLGFEGDSPTNVMKGEWTVAHSPLSVAVVQPDRSVVDVPMGKLAPQLVLASPSRDLKDSTPSPGP